MGDGTFAEHSHNLGSGSTVIARMSGVPNHANVRNVRGESVGVNFKPVSEGERGERGEVA